MPTYVFSKEAFMRFLESHLDDETVAVVSSDEVKMRRERVKSHLGEGDYYFSEFAVSADVFEGDFEDAVKYLVVFASLDELTEKGRNAIRK